MNAAQARRVVRLLEDLVHPHKDVNGHAYADGDLDAPAVRVGSVDVWERVEIQLVDFYVPGPSRTWRDASGGRHYLHGGQCELGITTAGALVAWSSVDIPRDDYDGVMRDEAARREESADPPPAWDLECWRHAATCWQVDLQPAREPRRRWVLDLAEGRPLVDPLPTYRAHRDAAAKAAA